MRSRAISEKAWAVELLKAWHKACHAAAMLAFFVTGMQETCATLPIFRSTSHDRIVSTRFTRMWQFPTRGRSIRPVQQKGACHDPGYELVYVYRGARDHKPHRNSFRHHRDVRAARLQPPARPDRAFPAVHDSDQRHRLPVSV